MHHHLTEDMINILNITAVIRIAILQPEHASCDVGRNALGVMHDNGLFAPGRHENLDGFVVIAIRWLDRSTRGGAGFASSANPQWYPRRVPA
jgi:hypothetical protein